ncbi:MAG: hypothetical protein WBF93_09000 [Pirellulales bacterium]
MQNEKENCEQQSARHVCPVCGGELIEIRAKLQCEMAPVCRTVRLLIFQRR